MKNAASIIFKYFFPVSCNSSDNKNFLQSFNFGFFKLKQLKNFNIFNVFLTLSLAIVL